MDRLDERGGRRIWAVGDEGPLLGSSRDASDLLGEALGADAEAIAVPAARLAPAFLQLRSGLAGEFIQKFVNYRLAFAVLGDISGPLTESEALRDFVRESNRGRSVFFLPDLDAFAARLAALGG
jgi:hypothetical protein